MTLMLDDLIAAAQAERARVGNVPVYPVLERGEVGITTHRPHQVSGHVGRDAFLAALALPVTSRDAEHGAYLITRALGDARAIRHHRLGRRLFRRTVTRRVLSKAWRGF